MKHLAVRALVLVPALTALAAPAAAQPDGDAAARQAGAILFKQLCATCHGDAGKGDGPQKVDPPPRDLTSGKFSFGNTRDAVFHTISRGIPPHMPAFEQSLSEEYRRAVTAHVMSLMPQVEASMPGQSRLEVGGEAVVVRGYLPERAKYELPVANGLVLGIPGGFSAVYRTDDVRLLEVRRGEFVERTDWRGRGGTPLELLGTSFYAIDGANPAPCFSAGDAPLRAALRGTSVRDASARVHYRLRDAHHRDVAAVDEEIGLQPVGGGVGLRRTLRFAPGRATAVTLRLGGLPSGARLLHRDATRAAEGRGAVARFVGRAGGDDLGHAWLIASGTTEAVALVADDNGAQARIAPGPDPAELRVLYLRTRGFDAQGLETVTQEVIR